MRRLRAIALAAILGIAAPALAQQGEPVEPPSAAPAAERVTGVIEPRVLPVPAGEPARAAPAEAPAAGALPLATPATPATPAPLPVAIPAAATPAAIPAGESARSESAEGAIAAAAATAAAATDAAPDAPDISAAPTFPAAAEGPVEALEVKPADLELPKSDAIAEPVYASIWERIRAGFKMPEIDDPLVRKWEEFYVARPEYWQRIIERGRRYLHFITEEIERRGMPLEIALLPIIESAYNPEALSRARASGIWQFVPATGETYGLRQNWWLDNRRDVTIATGSALDYLENLHTMFDDWQLALASYNWGEGAVQRAINRNRALGKPTDYASLKVPGETRNYLPKLQAVKNLIRAPEKFGVALPQVPDVPYLATVTTFRQIDVALAASLADMPIDEFKRLNPAHNRPVMAGAGGEQRIVVPYGKAESFVMNLDSYVKPLVTWRPYQLKHGERLDQIAPRFGIDVDELKRVNGLTGKKRVVPGHTLLVPARSGEATAERIPTAIFKEAPNAGPGWHRVRRGETLVAIANRYGVTAAELKQLNGLPGNSVAAGHRLRLHDGVSASAGKSRASGRARVAGKAKATGKVKAESRGVKKKSATGKRRR